MHTIHYVTETIFLGRATFRSYMACALGGRPSIVNSRFERNTGAEMIPGALMEAFELGLTDRDQLITAVGRATLCRDYNVEAVFEAIYGALPQYRNSKPSSLPPCGPDRIY